MIINSVVSHSSGHMPFFWFAECNGFDFLFNSWAILVIAIPEKYMGEGFDFQSAYLYSLLDSDGIDKYSIEFSNVKFPVFLSIFIFDK